jgi:hypothetical protein
VTVIPRENIWREKFKITTKFDISGFRPSSSDRVNPPRAGARSFSADAPRTEAPGLAGGVEDSAT